MLDQACPACGNWVLRDEASRIYHDTEWGVPVRDDAGLFELLVLESMQCGLSWSVVLRKREALRRALAGFDPEQLASFSADDEARATAFEGAIHSPRKVRAAVSNARAFLALRKEGGLARLLWSYTGGKMLVFASHAGAVPARTALSDEIAAELKQRGFTFVGGVTVYSLMQACGMVNDHNPACPRFRAVMEGAGVRMLP